MAARASEGPAATPASPTYAPGALWYMRVRRWQRHNSVEHALAVCGGEWGFLRGGGGVHEP
jgi:hypothetical protein